MPALADVFHGFLSVGYIATTGNNFYGETRRGGDFDYYEAGLNAMAELHPRLSVSGQVLARKAGQTDDGDLRVDYAFVDYRMLRGDALSVGVRLGRVRNPLGFYNEARDVIFTRPSILLPQSTYFEGIGIRELFFSSDGAQLYADWDGESSHTTFKFNHARTTDTSRQTRDNFAGSFPASVNITDLEIRSPVYAQILHELDGGRVCMAISYASGDLRGQLATLGFTAPVRLDAKVYFLSGQYNAENWSLTSEYTLTSSKLQGLGTGDTVYSDGMYLQYQYRFSPEWTGLLRQDVFYPDRDHRDESGRDTTLGVRWSLARNWLLSAEYHYIEGISGIPAADNRGRSLSEHTNLLALMLGFRF